MTAEEGRGSKRIALESVSQKDTYPRSFDGIDKTVHSNVSLSAFRHKHILAATLYCASKAQTEASTRPATPSFQLHHPLPLSWNLLIPMVR